MGASRELQLGRIALEGGDLVGAEWRLRRAIGEPGCPAKVRVDAYLALGRTLDRSGRRGEAQACYRRVLALTDDWRDRSLARRLYRGGNR